MGVTERPQHTERTRATSLSSSEVMAESKVDMQEQPHAEHGPLVDHKIPQDDVVQAQPDLAWSRMRHILREPLSEFFGESKGPVRKESG